MGGKLLIPKRILDLGCGCGGGAVGYERAWNCEILGIDIVEQPNYPFEFIQADFLEFDLDGYDFIHASPPCKRWAGRQMNYEHPDLLTPLRERLIRARTAEDKPTPWIIENVAQAPLRRDIQICGTALGLSDEKYELRRHRYFELFPEPMFIETWLCHHNYAKETVSVWGRSQKWVNYEKVASKLMGIDWAPWREFRDSIPPAYTHWLGNQLTIEWRKVRECENELASSL